MVETPAQSPEVQSSEASRSFSVVSSGVAICKRVVQWIPPKARLAALAGFLMLTGLVAYGVLSGGSGTLNLVCRHSLRSADLEVTIDGKLASADQFSGSSIKRFGLVGKRVEKTYSKSLAVSAGEHVVQVHLSSAADGFDQTKVRRVSLGDRKAATLLVVAQEDGMSLAFQGASMDQAEGIGSNYLSYVWSILITVVGSGVSAGIGFVVQEFLRRRTA